jgi:glycosyltransferase involved in cell wall biosynthesis
MHIAVLSDRYPLHPTGGAANVAASLAKRYRKQGHTVSVVTRSPNGEDRSIQKDGIRIYTIAAPELSSLQAYYSIYNPFILRSIRRIFSANDFDVVHAHNIHEFLSYHCLKIARKKSIPVVVTLHDAMSVSYGPIHQFINEMGCVESL